MEIKFKVMLNIALLLDSTTKYNILFFMIAKYDDNDCYSSPVPPRNGTVAKKRGSVFRQISAVPNPFFGMTNRPLHPLIAPKSTALQH